MKRLVRISTLLIGALIVISCNITSTKNIEKTIPITGTVFWLQNSDTILVKNESFRFGDIDSVTSEEGKFQFDIAPGRYRIQIFSSGNDLHRFYSDTIEVDTEMQELQLPIKVKSKYVDMLPLKEGQKLVYDYEYWQDDVGGGYSIKNEGSLNLEVTAINESSDSIRYFILSEEFSYTTTKDYTADSLGTEVANVLKTAECTIEEEIIKGNFDKIVSAYSTLNSSMFCGLLEFGNDGKGSATFTKYRAISELSDGKVYRYYNMGNQYTYEHTMSSDVGLYSYYRSNNIDYYLMFEIRQ